MPKADRDETVPSQTEGRSTASRLVDWAPQIIIGAVVIVFIAVNRRQVKVSYAFNDVKVPLWMALLVVALLGGAVGWFVGRRRLKQSGER